MKKRSTRCLILILMISIVLSVAFSANAAGGKINNSRKYIGMYTEGGAYTQFGTDINMIGWFDNLYAGASESKLKLCLDDHRYTAFITLQPKLSSTNNSKPDRDCLKKIANGSCDTMIRNYFRPIGSGDRRNTELFVRFAHEMEYYSNPWYQWQIKDYATYIKAWRRVYTIAKQEAPNVKFVWSPNRANDNSKNWYPGSSYVDYVSVTMNSNQTSKVEYATFKSFYEGVGKRTKLESYGKPIIFGEVAVNISNATAKEKYIGSLLDYVGSYSKCVGFVILNANVVNGNGIYRPFKFSHIASQKNAFVSRSRNLLFDFILPGTVKHIEDNAFQNTNFVNVYISNGTETIGSGAFANCGRLEMIRIPSSVTQIDSDAFEGSAKVEIFGAEGSAAQSVANERGIPFHVE